MRVRFLPLCLFVLAFQLEVRVRASIQESEHEVQVVKGMTAKVQLLPETLLEKKTPAVGRLVKGTVRAVTNDPFKLETVYGSATQVSGEFWAIGRSGEVLFRAVLGDVELKLRDGKKLVLPEGFQVWISGIDDEGKSLHGVPEAIPIKEHLALWARVHEGDQKSFREAVFALKERWKKTNDEASNMYQAIVDRHVASQREEAAEKARVARKKQLEFQQLREMYRSKVFDR